MTNWQTYCLALMGIEQWVMRSPDSICSKPLCIILVEDMLPLSENAQRLLTAMLRSIGLEMSQVYLTNQLTSIPIAQKVWIVGKPIVPPNLEMIYIMTEGLEEILATPLKKKQVYAQLAALIPDFSHFLRTVRPEERA